MRPLQVVLAVGVRCLGKAAESRINRSRDQQVEPASTNIATRAPCVVCRSVSRGWTVTSGLFPWRFKGSI